MDKQEMTEIILDGLCIDGEHHKQWSLEQLLIGLHGEDWVEKKRDEESWKKGIAS